MENTQLPAFHRKTIAIAPGLDTWEKVMPHVSETIKSVWEKSKSVHVEIVGEPGQGIEVHVFGIRK